MTKEPGPPERFDPYRPGTQGPEPPRWPTVPPPAPTPDPVAARPGPPTAALGFAAVLLVVLVLTLVGGWGEITRSWGLAGERGTFTAAGCDREVDADGEQSRSRCRGRFVPDDGGDAYEVEAAVDADTGEELPVVADGPGELAYRADLWGRWAAVALPLLPLGLLWFVPWAAWLLRLPGAARGGQRALFLTAGLAPAAVMLLLGAVGFAVAVAVS